jgi:acyl-CoA hydrolase
VGIARSDVHSLITQYGIAYLFGKPIRERAVALIEVAHPRCREELYLIPTVGGRDRLCHDTQQSLEGRRLTRQRPRP